VALKNQGSYGLNGTLVVIVNHLSDPSIAVKNADGFTPEGLAYYTFTTANGKLDPTQVTSEKTLVFKNPNGVQFSYDLTVLAELNAAPVIKSQPELEVIGGKKYQYQVKAEDLNGDSLSYKLLTAPSGMSIDPSTGLVNWNTSVGAVGTKRIIVEVSDGRGGITQQDYNLTVINTPANRPPIITSTPVVDAFIDKPYQDTATAIDPDGDVPISYSLITAPPGMTIDPLTGKIAWKPSPTVILGDTVLSRIRTPGEMNEFNFSGIKGQKIYFDPLQYAGAVGQWRFDLYSPTGKKIIDGANFEWNQSRLLTLVEDGNYHISVRTNGDATGNYGFRLIDAALTPQLKFDEKIQTQLTPGTQDRLFRFTGNQGQKLYFDQITKSGDLDWTIYNAANGAIASNTADDIEINLPANGDYILAVRGRSGFSSTATIDFTVIAPELTTQVMPLNTPISGAIAKRGEQDTYTFTGTAGQQLFYDALGGDYFTLRVLDPTGQQILVTDSRNDAGPDIQGLTLGINGNYQVIVDGNGGDIGNYRFRFLDKAAATLVSLDTDIVGKLDATNGTASYRFKVDTDKTYLYFDAQAGNYPNYWLLYGNDGKLVRDSYIYEDKEFAVKAGEYWLVMWGRDAADVNYKMRIVTSEFTTTPLVLNTVISGSISEAGERDTYTFTGVNGQQLWYDALGGDPLNVKLYDPLGKEFSSYTNDNRLDQGVDYFALKMDGTYKLVFDPAGDAKGNYKFKLSDKAQFTPILFNTEITGNFKQITSTGVDTNLYRFTATAGQKFYLDTGNGQSGNVWAVYGVDGKQLKSGQVQDNYYDDYEFDAPASGEYTLALIGYGATNPNYKFTLYAPDLTTTPLTMDSIISGKISQPGEQDSYTFSGTAGQQLFYDPLNSNNFAAIRIYDPNGAEIKLSNGRETQDVGMDYLTLNLNGTYKVVIDGDGANVGDYKFRLLDKANAPLITSNLEVTDTFDNNGLGSKLYRFNAQAGEHFYLNTGAGQYPNAWIIYDSNGQFVKYGYVQDSYSGGDWEFDISKTGEYTLALEGNGAANTNYKFTLTNSPLTTTPLTLGATVSGVISKQGEQDAYTFSGTAGQRLHFDYLARGVANSTTLRLYSPSGLEIGSRNFSDLDYRDFTSLKESGIYKVVVDGNGASTDNYSFRILDVSAATNISYDTDVSGQLATGQETVFYQFSGTKGQKLYLDWLSNSPNTQWSLYDAGSQPLVDLGGVDGEFTLTHDDTYTIAVRGYNGAAVDYKFRIITPDSNILAIGLGTYSNPNLVTGKIDEKGETDTYTFSGISGQKIYLDVINGGFSGNNYIKIYDSTGRELLNQNLSSGDTNPIVLTANGTYRVQIDGAGESTDTYQFSLLDLSQAVALNLNTAITGTLNNGKDTKFYQFTGTAGQRLKFDSLITTANTNWTLYDNFGQVLFNDSANTDREVTLNSSGSYLLGIKGNHSAAVNYQFQVLQLAVATPVVFTGTAIALNTPISGSISSTNPSFSQSYTFTGTAGQKLFYDSLSGDYNALAGQYFRVWIQDPAGKSVYPDIDYTGRGFEGRSDIGPDTGLTLGMDGTYRITFYNSGRGIGNYNFQLLDLSSAPQISFDTDIQGTLTSNASGSKAYRFNLTQRQHLFLDAQQGDGAWIIYKPNGQYVTSARFYEDRDLLLDAGEYSLVMQGYSSSPSYKFKLANLSTAPLVNLDTDIQGTFSSPATNVQTYRFNVTDKQYLYFDAQQGDGAWLVYKSNGDLLTSGRLYEDRELLVDAGEYALVMQGYNSNTNYKLRIVTPIVDSTPTAIDLNTTVSGAILEKGEQDKYTFTGTAGQQLFYDGRGDYFTFKLLDPTGKIIFATDSRIDRGPDSGLNLGITGTYQVIIDGEGEGNGNYQFRLLNRDTSSTLILDTNVAGVLSNLYDSVGYHLTLDSDRYIYFDTQAGAYPNRWLLYNSAGQNLVSNYIYDDTERKLAAGDYFLIMQGNGSTNLNYQIQLATPEFTTTPLTLGSIVSGSIGEAGEQDTYTFTGVNGQQLFYDALGGDLLNVKIYDPLGKEFSSYTNDNRLDQGFDYFALKMDGTYKLVIDPANNATGNYQFRLFDKSQATPLAFNTEVTGSLNQITPGDVDTNLYRFTATAGQKFYLDTSGGQANNSWIVYGVDGKLLNNGYVATGNRDDWEFDAPKTGEYVLAILGYGATNPNYKFTLYAPELTTTPISVGSVISGTISQPSEQDSYTFTGTSGQQLFYDALNSNNIAALRFYDPNGVEIKSYTGRASQDQGPDFLTLNLNGTYKVIIDGDGMNVGDYKFRLLDKANATVITPEVEITDTIDSNGIGSKLYRFNAQVGERFYLNTGGGQYNNAWGVYEPSGKFITYGYLQSNYDRDDWEFVATQSGEYTMYIQGNGAANSNYKFTLTNSPLPVTPLVLGSTISGTIAKQGEQDTYTFTGTAGQRLQFDYLAPGLANSTTLRIYNPSGLEIGIRNFSDLDYRDFTNLKENGIYKVVVDGNGASTDNYSFRILDVSAATNISYDTDISGRLATGQETVLYQFSGTKGDKLYLDWLSNSPSTQWSLYDAGSQPLVNLGVVDGEFTLTRDDTYTIAVRGYNGTAVDYKFRIIPSTVSSTAITIEDNNTPIVNGTIAKKGETDEFTFSGVAGQKIFYDQISLPNATLRVYTPTGVEVGKIYTPYDVDSFYQLSETGTYRVVVDGNGESTGDYSFRFLNGDRATILPLNTPATGNLTLNTSSSNIYRFSGTVGQHVYIDADGDGNNIWTIFNPNGEYVVRTNLSNDYEFDLTSTGQYTLAVLGRGGVNPNYQISVNTKADVAELTLGNPVSSNISQTGERDTYNFNGTVGQQLWFDTVVGNANIKAQLYSPTGKLVQDRDTSLDWGAFNLTETGAYRLVIDGAGATTGNYQFNLSDRSTAPTLKLGEAITGSLTSNTNLYKFAGKAGQVVKFDLAATTWTGANWTFVDPSGKVIAAPVAGSPDFQVALASDGNYTLALAGASSTAVNYSFTATDVTPVKVTPTGLNVIQSGTYLPGKVSEYSFSANAGTVVLYDSIQTTGYMLARLVNPNGTYVTLDPFNYSGGVITFDNSNYLNPVTLQQTGTYKLQTYSYYGFETGAYKYALRELPKNFGPGVSYLELDTPISGSLTSGESKVYTFQTNPGEKVLFNGIQGASVNARIYDVSGNEVFRFDNFNSNDSNLATLATGGIYNLVISPPLNSGVNNYQFQLLNTTSARAIPDNLAQAGSIANGQTSQIFKLGANAGERLFFDSLNATSTNRWKLYDAGNNLLFDNEQRTDAEVIAPTTGDYYLYFQGGTSTAPVNYNFRVVANTQPIADILTPGTGAVGSNPDTDGIATFAVKLGATDTKGASTTQDYRVRLWADPSNANPVIISEPVKRFALDDKGYRYQVNSIDANGDNLVYRLLDAPTGALIDRTSGELFWFPETIVKAGDKANFQVEVSDGRGGKDLQTFTVDVFGKLGTIQGSIFDDLNSNGFRDTKLIKGDNPAVVLAIDVSGSTIAPFYGEKGGKAISTVLQAEIAAAEALIDTVISQGGGDKVKFAIIPHQVSAYIQDMDLTTPGVQVYTTATADTNNNGIADIREILATYTPNGSNNFTTALQTIDTLFTALPGDPNLIFMSDGYGQLDPIVATQVATDIKSKGGNVTALAIGSASTLDTLKKISPDAQKVTDFKQLINIFSGVDESYALEPLKENVTVYLDLNNNGTFDASEPYQITHPNSQPEALGESSYYYRFDNLLPGTYTVRTIVPAGSAITTTPISFTDTITIAGEDIAHLSGLGKIGVPENIAPVFITTAPGLTKLKAGETFKYASIAVDGNADPLSFDLINAPIGMSVDKQTGIVVWKPTVAQIDGYYADINAEKQRLTALGRGAFARTTADFDLLLRVSDGKGGQSLQSLKVQLAPNNTAPLFTSTPPTINPQTGKVFKYQATATDADSSDLLTYSLINPVTGVAINASTGLLTWTPITSQTGKTNIGIKVNDGNGGEAIQSFNLDVITPIANRAPIINSSPRLITSTLTEYRYQINATDIDGDSLTYQLVNSPSGMAVDSKGLITWNPTAAQIGQYQVNLKVSDGSLVTNQSYKLDVTNQPVNHNPTITSVPTLVTNLERPYSYNLTATDSDGDSLTWSLDNAPAGMVIDANTGALRWNPSQNQIGTHTIAVRATDSLGAYTGQEYTLKVNGINTPPQIQSSPNTVGGLNSPYKYQVKAIDLEGDTLKYTLGRRPTGMVVDPNTGLITWTPNSAQIGTQTIDVLVTDAQGSVSTQTYNLVVGSTPINQPPNITSTPKFTSDINTKYQYQILATDPENQQLTYALTTAPNGMVIDANTGLITWNNPTLGNTQINITATDTSGAVATQGYTLKGTQNNAPTINSTPKTQVIIGNTYRYDVIAKDSDNDALTYSLDDTSKAAGITIDKLGRITWKPNSPNIGIKPVTVTVADTNGATATQTYNLEVLADNTAPVINLVRGTNIADIGETISFQVQATDNVGIKSKQLLINNQAIALDSNGVGTYKVTTAGIVTATAIVTDINGNTSTANTTTNIIDPTDIEAPTVKLDLSGITSGIITGRTDIKGTVTDTNLDYYTLEVARFGTDNWQEVFRGTTSITNGTLGKFDPSLLENDTYRVRLTAYDTSGRGSQIEDELEVTGDLKLGNFRLSFTDLTIPVTGIPISLTRTYDSLTSGTTDDFGYGWRMEFRDTDLRTSLKKDEYYEQLDYRTVGFNFGTRIYITLPGGKREGFTFEPKQVQGALGGVTGGRLFYPSFVADKGVTSTLTVPNAEIKGNADGSSAGAGDFSGNPNGVLLYKDGKLFNLAGRPYVPQDDGFGNRYLLTTKDGTVYEINATTGDLESVKDTNGNTLTYSDTEIKSSTGVSVKFERDNQGRITSVTDPLGQKVKYGYDAKGDLVSVSDRDGNETKFQYNATRSHYLDKIVDPLGREAVKTEYDEAGRLKKTANSSGNGVEFVYNPANSLETVKDALGNPTTYEYDSRGNVVTEVDALGGIIRRTYDDDTNMLSETDAEGSTKSYTYDSSRNRLTETDGLGNITRYTYNQFGFVTQKVNALGQTTKYEYDAKGNQTATINAIGKTRSIFNASGQITSIVDDKGQATNFVYDSSGRVTSKIDATGHTTKYTYNATGKLLSEIETVLNNGVATVYSEKKWTYDPTGKVTSNTDALGRTVRYEYDAAGRQTAIIQASMNNRRTEYQYDERGNLIKTILADGSSISTTYDALNREIATTDALGRTTQTIYDKLGRVVEVILPDATPTDLTDNPRTKAEYDKVGRVVKSIDELGRFSEYQYDAAGRTTWMKDALGNKSSYTYSTTGRRLTETNALGQTTKYIYDNLSRFIATEFADGTRISNTYNAIGNRDSSTDQAGRITYYEFDKLNRLTSTIYADATPNDLTDNPRTQTVYDELGRVIATIDENGNREEYEYDIAGQLIESRSDCLCRRKTYTYDNAGNKLTSTDPLGHATVYVYDVLDRLTQTNYADGTTSSLTYDTLGQVIAQTNQMGNTTQFEYDERNRNTAVIDALGQRTSYSYDIIGNLTSIKDANLHTTSYEYDALNRRTATIIPLGQRSTTSYDAIGNLATSTDLNGNTITYSYDVMNRLKTKQLGVNNSVNYSYTATGLMSSTIDARGTTSYDYDQRNRLVKQTETDGQTLQYTYDKASNRTSITTIAGTTNYGYNRYNELTTVTDKNGNVTTYTYDKAGNRTKIVMADGTVETRNYDALNRLVKQGTSNASGVIAGYTYTLDAGGKRVELLENNGRRVGYAYDKIDRLLTEQITDGTNGNRTTGYLYDAIGNRLSKTDSVAGVTSYVYDNNDRLLTETNGTKIITSTYDNNGSNLTRGDGTSLTTNTWDIEQRLIQSVTDGSTTSYQYDANGVRVSSKTGGVETRYLVDFNRPHASVVLEYNASGTPIVDYTYGIGLISQQRGSVTAFYHADGLGSTRFLTDIGGGVTDTYVYDAYGNTLSTSGTTVNNYLYTGEQFDKNLGEYYLRARYYNPSQGRFMGRDPFDGMLEQPLSLNKYAYVHGNPINNTDPTGMYSMTEVSQTLLIAGLLAVGAYALNNIYNASRSISGTAGNLGGSNTGNGSGNLAFRVKLILSLLAIKEIIVTQDQNGQAGIPIVFYGNTVLNNLQFQPITNTTQHITEAIFSGKEFVLSAWDVLPQGRSSDREWYTRTRLLYEDGGKINTCSPISRGIYSRENNGITGTCDEYPFYSSEQGGPENFPTRRVSLKLVPNWEAAPQGFLMDSGEGYLLRRAGVVPGDEEEKWYGVVPISSLPVSFWRSPNGRTFINSDRRGG
jgi:large repetitive protein